MVPGSSNTTAGGSPETAVRGSCSNSSQRSKLGWGVERAGRQKSGKKKRGGDNKCPSQRDFVCIHFNFPSFARFRCSHLQFVSRPSVRMRVPFRQGCFA